jgi:hypothetical protein
MHNYIWETGCRSRGAARTRRVIEVGAVAEQPTNDPVAALADFYGRTLPDLARVLTAHRFDSRGNCVGCSTRRPHTWSDCVHAFAACIAAGRLGPKDQRELTKLLNRALSTPEVERAMKKAALT